MAENFGTLGSAFVDLVARTDRLESQLESTKKSTSGLMSTVKDLAGAFGLVLSAAAVVSVFRELVGASLEFQQSLSNVNTLLAGTDTNIGTLQQGLLSLSGNLGSSKELADSLYESLSAGVEPARAIDFVTTATKLARSELFQAGDSAKLLATVMNAYGREVTNASHVSDVFVRTINVGIVRGNELAHALGNVIPTAAQAGISIEEVSAAVAVMTRTGIDADTATTSLNRAILSFIAPSKEAKKVAAEHGIELSATRLKQLGLRDAINEVVKATKGDLEAQAQMFGDIRGFRAALALTGAQANDFADILGKMKTSVGDTDEAFRRQQDNISTQWTNAWNNAQRIVDRFAATSSGPLLAALKSLNVALENGSPALTGVAFAFSALAIAMVGVPVVSFTISIAGMVAEMYALETALALAAGTTGAFSIALGTAQKTLALMAASPLAAAAALGILAYQLGEVWQLQKDISKAEEEAAGNRSRLAVATERLAKQLQTAGVDVTRKAGESLEAYNTRLIQLKQTVLATGKVFTEFAPPVEKAHKDIGAAVKKLSEEQQKLIDKFEKALKPADDLNKEFAKLAVAHVTNKQLVAAYGDEIIKAVEQQKAHGLAVSGDAARLYDWAIAAREVAHQADVAAAARRKLHQAFVENVAEPIPMPNTGEWQKALEKIAAGGGELPLRKKPVLPVVIPEISTGPLTKLAETEYEARQNAEALANEIRALSAIQMSDADIVLRLGSELDTAESNAKKFGFSLDSNVADLIKHKASTKQSSEEAKKWRDVWSNAMGRVVSDFSTGVADMIFNGKKFSTSFKSIFKDLASSIVKMLVTDAFTKVAHGLSNLLIGTKGKSGLLGNLGGSLGGLFGGLGGLFGGTAGAGGAAAGAGAGGAGGLASIGALATNPITIAAAAAVASAFAIHHFVGQGRRAANEWVQGTQNPFGENLSSIVDAFDNAKKAGSLTLDDAQKSRDALTELWKATKASAADYAGQGKTEKKVIDQFMAQMTELFGPELSKIFGGFDTTIADLQAKAAAAKKTEEAAATPGTEPGATTPAAAATVGASSDFGTAVAEFKDAVGRFAGLGGGLRVAAGIPQTGLAGSASEIFLEAVDRFKSIMAVVTPGAGRAPGSPIVLQLTVNNQFKMENGQMTAIEIRDTIIPEITDVLETGIRGVREKWAEIIRSSMQGIISTAPVPAG